MGEEKGTFRSRLWRLCGYVIPLVVIVALTVLVGAVIRGRMAVSQGGGGGSTWQMPAFIQRWEERSEKRHVERRLKEIRELEKAGGADAAVRLVGLMRDRNEEVCWSAAVVLDAFNDPAVVEPLIRALKDSRPHVRLAAAYALRRLNDPRAAELLIGAMKDGDAGVRSAAALALGDLKDPRAVEPLIAALKDSNWEVRAAAAWALGELKDPRAVEPLMEALNDGCADVRVSAATALGWLGEPRGIEVLIGALGDDPLYLRSAAAGALRQMTGQDLGEDQEKWRAWWEEHRNDEIRSPNDESNGKSE